MVTPPPQQYALKVCLIITVVTEILPHCVCTFFSGSSHGCNPWTPNGGNDF